MNLGIIIGVSEYSSEANSLPGCKIDAEYVNHILIKSNKYNEILFLNEATTSSSLKQRLTDFIFKYQNDQIDELFFYFTGHGEFLKEEFYYLLSDFNPSKRKQTTLQNEEVDTLIKNLNPNLVIKVLDACHSGKSYIKDLNVISKHFNDTKNEFRSCYFLASSLTDQYSYQTSKISDFTLSFVNSIKNHESNEIRYKDIIDYISDEFELNENQTPFFVVQANYTEKFCYINEALKSFLSGLEEVDNKPIRVQNSTLSIVDKVKKDAEDYRSKEQVKEVIDNLKSKCESVKLNDDLSELYRMELGFISDHAVVINKNSIAQWLQDNEHEYFAKLLYKRVRKDRFTNPFGLLTENIYSALSDKNDDKYESIIDGFVVDVETPFKSVVINLNSNYPNINSFTCQIVFFMSKKSIRFFYLITNFKEINWDEKKVNTDANWLYTEEVSIDMTPVNGIIDKVFSDLQEVVGNYLKKAFIDGSPSA
jgi:hypothetical protein